MRDHRVLDFQMQPQVIVPTEQLLGRADELRRVRIRTCRARRTAPQGAVPQGSYPENTPATADHAGGKLSPPPSLPTGADVPGANQRSVGGRRSRISAAPLCRLRRRPTHRSAASGSGRIIPPAIRRITTPAELLSD